MYGCKLQYLDSPVLLRDMLVPTTADGLTCAFPKVPLRSSSRPSIDFEPSPFGPGLISLLHNSAGLVRYGGARRMNDIVEFNKSVLLSVARLGRLLPSDACTP